MKKVITFLLFIGLIALSLWGYQEQHNQFLSEKNETRQFYKRMLNEQKEKYLSKIDLIESEKKTQLTKIQKLEEELKVEKEKVKISSNTESISVSSTTSESKKVNCGTCYGSGNCRHCGGDGRTPCTMHDTNNDGYCSQCNNTRQENCYICSASSGRCGTCYGSGKVYL